MNQASLEEFKCPNCGNVLKINETEMKVKCEFCEAEFLVKDFVTEDRINAQDKLKSFGALIDNAIQNNDWGTVYKYFEKTCEVSGTPENLAMLNMSAYMWGHLPFNERFLRELAFLPIDQRKTYVTYMKKRALIDREYDFKGVEKNTPKYQELTKKYSYILGAIDQELALLEPLKCICGNTIEAGEYVCKNCNKNRKDVIEEKKKKDKMTKTIIVLILVALLVVFPMVSCVSCVACVACMPSSEDPSTSTSQTSSITEEPETTTAGATSE